MIINSLFLNRTPNCPRLFRWHETPEFGSQPNPSNGSIECYLAININVTSLQHFYVIEINK